jgi:hypothetical protein
VRQAEFSALLKAHGSRLFAEFLALLTAHGSRLFAPGSLKTSYLRCHSCGGRNPVFSFSFNLQPVPGSKQQVLPARDGSRGVITWNFSGVVHDPELWFFLYFNPCNL